VEHACHQCGAAVEDGIGFCPACGAAQIRVSGSAAPEPVLGALLVAEATQIDWHQAFSSAVVAGVAAALFCLVPLLGFLFFVWMLAGGALCVSLYRNRTHALITPGIGARLGAVSGIFAFAVFAIVQSLQMLLVRGEELRTAMRQSIQDAAARNPDPNMQQLVQRMLTPEGLAVVIALTLMLFFAGFVALGSLGGALWASRGVREKPGER